MTTTTLCPRCGGPADESRTGPGFPRPGALSRYDNETTVCSGCGTDEAMRGFAGSPLPRSQWYDRTAGHAR